jgi:hypothetical protein
MSKEKRYFQWKDASPEKDNNHHLIGPSSIIFLDGVIEITSE